MRHTERKVEEHEAYGMVQVSHTSGQVSLFGSEFAHQHYVTLTIRRGKRRRDLSNDWYSGHEELIEVAMSESQFVEMVARPNMGSGVPCTIQHVAGKRMARIPPPEPMTKRYGKDLRSDAGKCVSDLRSATAELREAIESGKVGKTALREIVQKLDAAAGAVDRGMPFVVNEFCEEMEKVVNRASIEIEAAVSATAMRLGIERMHEICNNRPTMITDGEESEA